MTELPPVTGRVVTPLPPVPVLRRPLPVREKRTRGSRRLPRMAAQQLAGRTRPHVAKLRAALPDRPDSSPEWLLRPLRPSDALVWSFGRMWEGTRDLKEFTGAALVALFIGWLTLSWPPLAAALVVAATLLGLLLAYKAWIGDARRGVTVGKALLLAAAASNTGWWLLYFEGLPLAAAAASLAYAELYCRLCEPKGTVRIPPWYSAEKISLALVTAGVLKAIKTPDGLEQLPPIHYPGGPPQHKPTGVWVTFGLPAGSTWQHVVKRHAELASAMGVDPDRLHIEKVPGNGSAVRIAVLNARGEAPDAVIPNGPTDWTRPIELLDTLGRTVRLLTLNVHTAFVGATGSGKTWLARWVVLWAILDPRVPLAMLSGKDDEEDWQPMRPLCFRYVGGSKEQSCRDAAAFLRELLDLSEQRGGVSKQHRVPMVVVVDEWFRLVKAARRYDKALADQLVADLEELAATCRSRNMHIVTTFQRGTEGYISKDLNGNLVQKCVGLTVSPKEVHYVLDTIPPRLPQQSGDFLVAYEDGTPSLVQVPKLTDELFAEACRRGLELRGGIVRPEVLVPAEPAVAPTVDLDKHVTVLRAVSADPFGDAVRALLRDHGELTGAELHDKLPADLRGANAAMTGKAVARVAGVNVAWKAKEPGGKRNLKAWGLLAAAPGHPPVGAPTDTRAAHGAAGSSPRTVGSELALHAQRTDSAALAVAVGSEP